VTDLDVTGLSSAQVAQRVAGGRVNVVAESSSRSLLTILRGNVFTLFNAILGVALVVVLVVGEWQDALFGGVLVFNAAIGVIGEYRAKRVLDRLSILHAPDARVVREGIEVSIVTQAIVVDDVLLVSAGDQVPVDAVVLHSSGLEVDESLLTGESEAVIKHVGDDVLSGSIVVAGSARTRVHHVGAESYANRLTSSARRFSLVRSELRVGINRVLVIVTWIIAPLSLLLIWSQIRSSGGWSAALADGSWRHAVVAGVAGVVGMVPEGLVLLTSINFALAAVLLARRQVLVQELPAVEVLARVDVLCLDKTGTLTDGTMALDRLEELAAVAGARAALAAIAADPQANVTAAAFAEGLTGVEPATVLAAVPFSSARKWSAVTTSAGTWLLGAPDILLATRAADGIDAVLARTSAAAQDGARVVVLCHAPGIETADDIDTGPGAVLPETLVPAILVVLRERLRPDAAQTLAYFREQGVELKIISGDNPATVAAIASSLDLLGSGERVHGVDAAGLPADEGALALVLAEHQVFGRVTPEQKRAMVHALQHSGHTVAMTGDGVNDALALKDADLGIAMGSGAAATKAVARLVLLDGKFASLPGVVAEGRRVIANMERVANLFLTKTMYASLLAVASVLLVMPYPFQPRHLTLVSVLTIGVPAFILALAPNSQRYLSGFLPRVLRFAVPTGVLMGLAVLAVYVPLHARGDQEQAATAATAILLGSGLWVIGVLARPWTWWRVALVSLMALAGAGAFVVPVAREFFALHVPTGPTAALVAVVAVVTCAAIETAAWLQRRRVP
jgi:cation-transporting ATPase E